jgi:hypothetical protein
VYTLSEETSAFLKGVISELCTAAKTRQPPFNRTQSRVVIGLLTGRNTLRKHLHIMGLTDPSVGNAEWRRRPQVMFCVCVKLWRHS